MGDVREIVVPLDKPQRLKVMFNNSAYMLVKELTGKSVYALVENQENLKDPKVCVDLLYAGTRKYHSNPNISHEQLIEWLDIVDSSVAFEIYGQVMTIFCASFLPHGKRVTFWASVDAKLAKKEEKQTPA